MKCPVHQTERQVVTARTLEAQQSASIARAKHHYRLTAEMNSLLGLSAMASASSRLGNMRND